MHKKIDQLVKAMERDIINVRRDIHKYPEPGWTEFRTSALIAKFLENLGYTIYLGKEVSKEGSRLGVPSIEVLEKEMKRAKEQGAAEKYLQAMEGGYTGVIAELDTKRPGPMMAMRFDIDSNDGMEAKDDGHRPYKEGFSSVNERAMHTCGHDGHTSIGLHVAKVLMEIKDTLHGKIRFIFQPAEEGVRGAYSVVEKGWLDDVDYFLTGHIGSGVQGGIGELILGMKGYMATTKLDVEIKGKNAHAGGAPQDGHNALLAAATAVLNMQSFLQHSGGATRLNVGTLEAGTGRNVVPANATMKLETRGRENHINEYVENHARNVIKSACEMYGVTYEIKKAGASISAASDEAMEDVVRDAITDLIEKKEITNILPGIYSSGSEDACYMIKRVQEKGGIAAYMGLGTTQTAGNHNSYYDFDEATMPLAVRIFARAVHHISNIKG